MIEIAEAKGEAAGALRELRYERSYGGELVLNIQDPSISYGTAYAQCRIINALKAKGQYFELPAAEGRDVTAYVSSRRAK